MHDKMIATIMNVQGHFFYYFDNCYESLSRACQHHKIVKRLVDGHLGGLDKKIDGERTICTVQLSKVAEQFCV